MHTRISRGATRSAAERATVFARLLRHRTPPTRLPSAPNEAAAAAARRSEARVQTNASFASDRTLSAAIACRSEFIASAVAASGAFGCERRRRCRRHTATCKLARDKTIASRRQEAAQRVEKKRFRWADSEEDMPSESVSWGYTSGDKHALGPDEWPRHFRAGSHQSPIDIRVDVCCTGGNQPLASCACASLAETMRRHATLAPQQTDSPKPVAPVRRRREHLDSLLDESERCDSTPSPTPHAAKQLQANDKRRTVSRTSSSSGNSSDVDELASSTSTSPSPGGGCNTQRRPQQNTRLCATNKKIFLGYPRYVNTMQLCNTGHAWQLNLPEELADHTRK